MNYTLLLGKLHPMLVHLPIAIVLFAAVQTLMSQAHESAEKRPWLSKIWMLGGVAALVACVSGWMLSAEVAAEKNISAHRNWGIGATVLTLLLAYLSRKRAKQLRVIKIATTALLFSLIATLHLGTTLTHGEHYYLMNESAAAQTPTDESGAPPHPDLPRDVTVPFASVETIQAVEKTGLRVLPVSEGSAWLYVSAANASHFSDSMASVLLAMAQQVVWLRLSGCKEVGDSTAHIIGQLPHLTRLHLDGTGVSDRGIARLSALKQLRKLNLVGTRVTAQGLAALSGLPQLKHLYLYATPIPSAQWPAMQALFPHATIDTGGYQLPETASDSMKQDKKNSR